MTRKVDEKVELNQDTKDYLKKLANLSRFREKDLHFFYLEKILTGDEDKDRETLNLISRIWFSRKFIRRILSYLTKNQRKYLLKTCDIPKPEVFVLSQLQTGQSVKKIYRRLITQLKQFYGLSTEQAKKTISNAARRERMKRYYQRKKVEK